MKQKKHVHLFLLIIAASLLTGCSTTEKLLPGEVVEKRNKAAEYAEYGTKYYNEADYSQALDFFFLALKENILVDSEKGIAESYNSIGKTYLTAGKTATAQEYFLKARDVAEHLNDPGLIIRCTNNSGEVFLANQAYKSALNTFRKAFALIESPQKYEDSAVILHNLGVTYKRLENYEKAEEYLLLSLEYNGKNEKYKEMASDNYVLASIYSKKGDYSRAESYINKALEFDRRTENSYGITKDLTAKGLILRKSEQKEEAYYIFKRGALVAESLSLPQDLILCLKNLEELSKELSYSEDTRLWRTTREKLEEKLDSETNK